MLMVWSLLGVSGVWGMVLYQSLLDSELSQWPHWAMGQLQTERPEVPGPMPGPACLL